VAKKDSVCDSCTSKSENCEQTCEKKDQIKVKDNVKSVIAVMSGKGGVGKSTVSALLASSMAKNGHKVGILDADITGPSIPRLLGLKGGSVKTSEQGMVPPQTSMGIKVMSLMPGA
jgi:Mrp family chromosome partitioning ATPase